MKSPNFFFGLLIGLSILTMQIPPVYSEELSRETDRGLFSLGVTGGIGNFRFLNTDGSYSGYDFNGYGIDLDIQLLNFGQGAIRFWGNFSEAEGTHTKFNDDELKYSEVSFGLKFYPTSWIYMGGGIGQASADLNSETAIRDLSLSYPISRMVGGLEFSIFESVYAGLEVSYRNGSIKESENSALTENSYAEGLTYMIKLMWCPPFTTINLLSK